MERLYSSYRKGAYTEKRKYWEPWMRDKDIGGFDPLLDKENVQKRRMLIEDAFNESGINRDFELTVDFGGDQGQFFPKQSIGKKFLLDLSASSKPDYADKDFSLISSLSEVGQGIDLILNCFVLEHVSQPKDFLKSLKVHLRENGVLFIQVPLDYFTVSKFHRTLIYKKYLCLINRTKYLFILFDFLTGVYRLLTRRIPFWGICKQSEHINYFSTFSLNLLCSSISEDVWVSDPNMKYGHGRLPAGHISAMIKQSS
jgi:SAM-dependent methyltransferase